MRVRVKDVGADKWVGYYNLVRRKAGDVFDLLVDSHFSEKWMERVDKTTPKSDAPGEPDIKDLMADGIVPEKRSPGRPRASA